MSRALTLALLLSCAVIPHAFAETEAETKARTAAAVDACDRGASAPLDPLAKAPVVHWGEFQKGDDINASVSRIRQLAKDCATAAKAEPGDRRLALEALRAELAAALIDYALLLPSQRLESGAIAGALRPLAREGSAEANFLLFEIFRTVGDVADKPMGGVSRDEALAALAAAAEAGHLEALLTTVDQRWNGGYLRRDALAAAAAAEAIVDLRRQGPSPAGDYEVAARDRAKLDRAAIILTHDGFPADEAAEAFAAVKAMIDGKDSNALLPYVAALRAGRGTAKDPAAARTVLEAALAAGSELARGPLAEMMANGEGGREDGKAALALLANKDRLLPNARVVLARLYLDNRFTGRRPREAVRLLTGFDAGLDPLIEAVPLLVDYDEKTEVGPLLVRLLKRAAEAGEPAAAMALARLKLSDNREYGGDADGARALLVGLATAGDRDAALMVAETQYANLGESSFKPRRRAGGMTDAEIEATVEKAIADGRAAGHRVKARLQRVGVVYPQDDRAATASLLAAAELGDVEAMILLGKAYDDGLGVEKSPRERLRWWRAAAKLGSIEARQRLADAFTFDFFDKLLTLREGVTEQIALYNDAAGDHESSGFGGDTMATMHVSGVFSGSRVGQAGVPAVAAAVMEAFRLAPAGLDEARLLPLMRTTPPGVRIAIEAKLKEEGFFAGTPDGNFGPDVRAALAAWVDARGPLNEEAEAAAVAPAPDPAATITAEQATAIRDTAFAAARAAKTDEEIRTAIAAINTLARAGDMVSRWAIVSAYDNVPLIPAVVTPEEMTRYGLDLMVTRPEGAEKLEFEVIFNISSLYQTGAIGRFGEAVVAAVRDDRRLQDPLTLGGILQQMIFAPGACDAIAAAVKSAGGAEAGEGCDGAAQAALIALARDKGPSGVDAAARAAALEELKKLGG